MVAMAEHRVIHLVIISLTAAFTIITMGVFADGMTKYNIFTEWFGRTKMGDNYFHLAYGPPPWLSNMFWTFIFLFALGWMAYSILGIFRTTPDSSCYLYYYPNYQPPAMYCAFLTAMLLRLSWAAILPRCSPVCVALVTGSAICATICLIIGYRALNSTGAELYKMGLYRDVATVRGLVHNGLAMYATWEWGAWFVHIAGVMTANGGSQRDAAAMMLGLILLITVVYVLVDILVVDKYSRYTLSPYVVLFFAMVGFLERHWYSEAVSPLAFVVLGVGIFGLIFKVVWIFDRGVNDPEPIDGAQELAKAATNPQSQLPDNGNIMPMMIMPETGPTRLWIQNPSLYV